MRLRTSEISNGSLDELGGATERECERATVSAEGATEREGPTGLVPGLSAPSHWIRHSAHRSVAPHLLPWLVFSERPNQVLPTNHALITQALDLIVAICNLEGLHCVLAQGGRRGRTDPVSRTA